MKNSFNEELRLIKSMKSGDMEAFVQIIRMHQDFVNKAAFNLAGEREAANELVILTYLDLWTNRRYCTGKQPLKVYFMNALHKVARANPKLFELKPLRKDGPCGWLLTEKIEGFSPA